jgi:hypothetical protein
MGNNILAAQKQMAYGDLSEITDRQLIEATFRQLQEVREWQDRCTAIVEDIGAKAQALLDNPMVKAFVESQSGMFGL